MSAETHPGPTELSAQQDAIYLEKVTRARGLTLEERFADTVALTTHSFQQMLEGALWQLDTSDEEKGWKEVRRRLDILSRLQDRPPKTSANSHSS